MPSFLESMRLKNLFPPVYGNDLPSQGGITGRMPIPPELINPAQLDTTGMYGPSANMGVTNSPDIGMPPPMIPPSPDYDVETRMREIYKPTTDATNRFEELINKYPQRENPSWLRRIGSMVVDYTKGSKEGQAFYNKPFNQKQEDWKEQIGPAQQSANLERQENVNQRTLAYQTISAELRDRAQLAKERKDEAQMKINQQRADLYDFKARHPGWKIIPTKGGNVQAIDPVTNQVHDLGIPTGGLTKTDELNMVQEDKLEAIKETGTQARQTENVRQTGRIAVTKERGIQARDTKATPSSSTTGKSETAANKKVREYLLARELYNSNPKLRDFIHLDNSGPNSFTLDFPTSNKMWGDSGPTQSQSKFMQDYIYSEIPSISLNLPPGTIKVEKDGETGTFKGTEAEAITAGYKVVR